MLSGLFLAHLDRGNLPKALACLERMDTTPDSQGTQSLRVGHWMVYSATVLKKGHSKHSFQRGLAAATRSVELFREAGDAEGEARAQRVRAHAQDLLEPRFGRPTRFALYLTLFGVGFLLANVGAYLLGATWSGPLTLLLGAAGGLLYGFVTYRGGRT